MILAVAYLAFGVLACGLLVVAVMDWHKQGLDFEDDE